MDSCSPVDLRSPSKQESQTCSSFTPICPTLQGGQDTIVSQRVIPSLRERGDQGVSFEEGAKQGKCSFFTSLLKMEG